MKMQAIIVKQGFMVIVAFYYNHCLFRNHVLTILKVVGCEDCMQENKLPLWGPGSEAPSLWVVLSIFSEKKLAISTPFG